MKHLWLILFVTNFVFGQTSKPLSVDSLDWLTGSWQGPINGNILEETWLTPRSGTIVALVRSTNESGTDFVEIIHIKELNGTLELHLKLLDNALSPTTPKAHKFELTKIDKDYISNIITFGDKIILHVGKKLIVGNPHKEHLINWINPYSDLSEEVKAININNGNMVGVSSKAAYLLKNGDIPKTLISDHKNLSLISHIEVIDDQSFIAISDSIFFNVSKDKIEKKYSNEFLNFSAITNYNSQSWVGTEIGFGEINDGKFQLIANNQPYINSSDVIFFSGSDKYLIASKKGISLSGWTNLSVKNYLDQNLDKLSLKNIGFDLGKYFSEIIYLDSIVYLGMYYSTSAGIASFDISNELKLDNMLIKNKDMSLNGFHFFVLDLTLDQQNNLWAISKNNKMKPITIIKGEEYR